MSYYSKMILMVMLVVLSSTTSKGQCSLDKSSWELVFEENFDAGVAGLSQNWSFTYADGRNFEAICGPGSSQVCLPSSNVSVSNGNLYLNAKKLSGSTSCGPNTSSYTGSILRSKFDQFPYSFCSSGQHSEGGQLYGMYEVRCKLPATPGTVAAFWLTPHNAWPPEIDVFEYKGTDRNQFYSSTHYINKSGKNDYCTNFYSFPYQLSYEFHTWTVVWTPTEITWFFDGKEIKSTDLNLPGQNMASTEICKWRKMDLILSNVVGCPSSSNSTFDPLIVDYVKIYRPVGLPQYAGGNSGTNFASYINNTLNPKYGSTSYKPVKDWNLTKIITPQYHDYNVKSNLRVAQGGGKFIYKGDGDLLWNTYTANGTMYSSPYSWSSDYKVTDDISIAKNGDIIFFRSQNSLKYLQGGQLRSLSNASNIVAGGVICDESGLHIYFVDLQGRIRHAYRASESSHTWTLDLLPAHGGGSKMIISPVNANAIFCLNSSKNLVTITKGAGSSYSLAAISNTGNATSDLDISADGKKIVFKTSTNRLYLLNKPTSGLWPALEILAKYPWNPGYTSVNNIASSIAIGESPFQVFYIGTDKRVWILYTDKDLKYQAVSVDWNVKYANFGLTVADDDNGVIAFVGDDNKIRRMKYGTCNQLNPVCNTTVQKSNFDDTYTDMVQLDDVNFVSNSQGTDQVIVYPNPTDGIGYVKTSGTINFQELVISDIYGKVIRSYKINKMQVFSFDISTAPHGAYFVTLRGNKNMVVRKIIKQ